MMGILRFGWLHLRCFPSLHFSILYLSGNKLKNLNLFSQKSRCENSIDTLSFVIVLFASLYLELVVRNIGFGEFTYHCYFLLLLFSNHVYTNDSRS